MENHFIYHMSVIQKHFKKSLSDVFSLLNTPIHILTHRVMISNVRLNRENLKSLKDWDSSVNVLTILLYGSANSVMMPKFQPNPSTKPATDPLNSSLLFSLAGHLLHCQSNSPGRAEISFIFHSNEPLLCGGRNRSDEGRGFIGLGFVCTFYFIFIVCSSRMTYTPSGLFSRFFLDAYS